MRLWGEDMETETENIFPYIRTIDFSWYGVDTGEVNRRFAEHHYRTKSLHEALSRLPERQRHSDSFIQWHEIAERDKLTFAQLHSMLIDYYGVRSPNYEGREVLWRWLESSDITKKEKSQAMDKWSHRRWDAERQAKLLEATADRILNGRPLPTIEAARDYGIMRMVVAPDGVTDDYCYNFRSISRKHRGKLEQEMWPLIGATNIDAYLLGRPNIVVHIHVRGTEIEQIFSGPADYERAQKALPRHEKKMIRDWGAGSYWQKRLEGRN
jgi:hypothetical protein